MFNKIKSFLGINEINQGSEGAFYPMMNTNYRVNSISRTDYLSLYTGWVYVATSTISDSLAELEFNTIRGEKELEHKYNHLIDYDFIKKVSSFMLLNGNCFVYKEMIGNKVDSLAILRPDLVIIEENGDGSLRGYRYNGYGKNMFFTPDQLINFEMFSPFETFPGKSKGVSPIQAVAIQAEMDRTANLWNWNFFKNGGSVRDILSTDQTIKSENKQRILADWKNKYQGVNNAHKIAILDNGLKYTSFAPSQKELDFVESRRFTRDEILAIYKIPKTIIGIDENANKASATVAENTYYRVCIRPLARQIAQKLTKELYNNEVTFKFINIVPKDNEQLLLDLNNGAITINEYRQAIGYEEIKNGNILKINEFQTIPSEGIKKQEEKSNDYSDIIKKTLRKNTKGTEEHKQAREEYGQKKWERKIQRTDKYEIKYIEAVKKIFDTQLADLRDLQKGVKKVKKPKFNEAKYKTLWTVLLTPIMKDVLLYEGNEALKEIGLTTMFEIGNPAINKYIRDNIDRVAKDVDNVTKEKIFDLIEEGNDEGLGADAIARKISSKFEDFKKSRSLAIARTEITNASTQAEIMAWDNSGVVEGKEWFTATDERVCANCGPMNGKIVGLKTDFFKKGEVAPGGLVLDYTNIDGPSLHTNCRCTLLSVLK